MKYPYRGQQADGPRGGALALQFGHSPFPAGWGSACFILYSTYDIAVWARSQVDQYDIDLVQQLHYHGVMPVMHNFSASRVVMYAGDHLLAHVHVQLRDGRDCTVELDSLAMVGRIAMREIREELTWIESNRAWLHDEWRRLNP